MRILFALAEAGPFAKTGGLGDVGGSLPAALQRQDMEVRVIMPKHSVMAEELSRNLKLLARFKVRLGWRSQYCGLLESRQGGIHYYFIDNEDYFKRDRLYGYDDDGERFAFFSKAVLESLVRIEGFKPDIIHCHDWHTALIPWLIKEEYGCHPYYYGIKSVFTIHNLKYQGSFPAHIMEDVLGINPGSKAEDRLGLGGGANFMKGGLLCADRITTVSPTYAREIQTPYYGENLDGILRERRHMLSGILNGIDDISYDPRTDPALWVNYGSSLGKKGENKQALRHFLGLPEGEGPVLVMVSRLVSQKGLDLVIGVLDEILSLDVQLVILGAGDQDYESRLEDRAATHQGRMVFRKEFDEELARKIYGGADLFLMPSLFEPCGLSQMIAMRYGTLPLVRETGGLKDSVMPYNQYTGEGNGFSFANYNAHELLFTVQKAVQLFREDQETWRRIVGNALKSDFSWEQSAGKYIGLYKELVHETECLP